jgi:hypothetical protein
MKKCLKKWLEAEEKIFDLWDIEFTVNEKEGCFRKVEKN